MFRRSLCYTILHTCMCCNTQNEDTHITQQTRCVCCLFVCLFCCVCLIAFSLGILSPCFVFSYFKTHLVLSNYFVFEPIPVLNILLHIFHVQASFWFCCFCVLLCSVLVLCDFECHAIIKQHQHNYLMPGIKQLTSFWAITVVLSRSHVLNQ